MGNKNNKKDSLKSVTVKALEISQFPRDSLTLLRTLSIVVSLFSRQKDNATDIMLHCIAFWDSTVKLLWLEHLWDHEN